MESRSSNAKKWAFYAVFALFLALVSFVAGIYTRQHVMFWDHPRKLSDKIESIEVSYVQWACDCPNWLPANTLKEDEEITEEHCIFIEPAPNAPEIPEKFWKLDLSEQKLRLTGSFYKRKGIPKGYAMETEVKPQKAKVFRYTELEVANQ